MLDRGEVDIFFWLRYCLRTGKGSDGVDLGTWLTLLKQYGPLLGFFLAFIIWQSRQINKLLDRNTAVYDSEIKRLAEVQERLLTHILGAQPSSEEAPSITALKKNASQQVGS